LCLGVRRPVLGAKQGVFKEKVLRRAYRYFLLGYASFEGIKCKRLIKSFMIARMRIFIYPMAK
jgi:hypothetical protein